MKLKMKREDIAQRRARNYSTFLQAEDIVCRPEMEIFVFNVSKVV